MANDPLISVDFEVFGKVQGCSFTTYCKDICEEMAVMGWVKNSRKGTIIGKLQGPRSSVEYVSEWLCKTGSPSCKIEHCEFENWQNLAKYEYNNFIVRF